VVEVEGWEEEWKERIEDALRWVEEAGWDESRHGQSVDGDAAGVVRGRDAGVGIVCCGLLGRS